MADTEFLDNLNKELFAPPSGNFLDDLNKELFRDREPARSGDLANNGLALQAKALEEAEPVRQPLLRANQIRDMAREFPGRNDALPTSMPDALAAARTSGFDFRFDNQQMEEMESLANGMAYGLLEQLDIADSTGHVSPRVSGEMFQKLTGSYRRLLPHMFGKMTPEEERDVSGGAMREVFGKIQQDLTIKLNQLQSAKTQGGGVLEFGPEGAKQTFDSSNDAKIQELQIDAAQAQEFASLSTDPRFQDYFIYNLNNSIDRLKVDTPVESDEAVELGLAKSTLRTTKLVSKSLRDIKDDVLAGQQLAGQPAYIRMEGLLNRNLSTSAFPTGPEQAVSDAFRGVLYNQRLARLGFTDRDANPMNLDQAALVLDQPIFFELANIAAETQVKRGLGVSENEVVPDAVKDKVTRRFKEELPGVIMSMGNVGTTGLLALKAREIRPSTDSNSQAIADAMDIALGELSSAFNRGTGVIRAVEKFLTATKPTLDPESAAGSIVGLAGSAMTIEAYAKYKALRDQVDAIDERTGFDDEDQVILPGDITMRTGNIPKEMSAAALTAKSWVVGETLFNPDHTMLASLSLLFNQDKADEVMEALGPLGVDPRVMRNVLKEASLERATQMLEGIGVSDSVVEARKAAASITQREWAAKPDFTNSVRMLKDTVFLAPMLAGNEFQKFLRFGLGAPEEAASIMAVGTVVGNVGLAAVAPLKNKAANSIANHFFMKRASRTLANAGAASVEATENMLRIFRARAKNMKPGAALRNMEAMLNNLETMADAHNMPLVEAAGSTLRTNRVRPFSRATQEFRNRLRRVGAPDLFEALEGVGVDGLTMARLTERGVGNLVTDLAEGVQETFEFEKFKVPSFVANDSPQLMRSIRDAVEAGVDPSEWGELPVSFDALARSGGGLRIAWNERMQQLFPRGRKALLEGSLVRDIAKFYTGFKKQFVAQRHLIADQLGDVDDFMNMARRRNINSIKNLQAAKAAAPDAEGAGRVTEVQRQLGGETQKIMAQQRAINDTIWDEPINLNRTDWARNMPLEDSYYWAASRQGEEVVYDRLRKFGESRRDFQDRVQTLLERHDEPDGRIRRGLDTQAEKLHRDILDTFVRADGLRDKIILDATTNDALGAGVSKRLGRRRRSVQHAAGKVDELTASLEGLSGDAAARTSKRIAQLEKKLEFESDAEVDLAMRSDLGLVKTGGVREQWKAMQQQANLETAAGGDPHRADTGLFKRLAVRMQDLDDLPMDLQKKEMNDFIISFHENHGIQQWKLAEWNRELANLTDDQRLLLDTALEHQTRFKNSVPLAELREKMPEVFRLLPDSDDAAVQGLLNHADDFRTNLLMDLAEGRGLDVRAAKELETLVGPYAPQRFMTHESAGLLGDVLRAPSLATKVTPGGLDLSFLEPQRDITRTRALVFVRGGKPLRKKFANRAEATEWVRSRHGIQSKDKITDGVEGKTDLGDGFAILDPIGEERAAVLGKLGPSKGLSLRLRELLEQSLRLRFLKTLDKPKWALQKNDPFFETPQGLNALKRKQFIDMPEGFGSLSGKRVHRRVVAAFNDFNESAVAMGHVFDTMREAQDSLQVLSSFLSKLPLGIGKATQFTKRLIIQNGLARNPSAMINNAVGDKFIFGYTMTGDTGFFASKLGWTASKDFGGDLWKFMMRGDRVESPLFKEYMDSGGLDDISVVGRLDPGLRKAMNDVFFGKDAPTLPGKVKAWIDSIGNKGDNGPLRSLQRACGSVNDDTKVQVLADRLDQIENTIANRGDLLRPRERAKMISERETIKSKLLKNPGIHRSMGRGLSQLVGWLSGAPKGVLKDTQLFSSRLYSYINNVNRGAAYYYMRAKGLSPEYAMWRINTFGQHFSRVPRGIRAFSKNPLANPILSFPYETARITGNLAKYDIGKLAGIMSATPMLNFYSLATSGVDPYAAQEIMGQGSPFGKGEIFMGGLMIPSFDGNFNHVSLPSINPWQFIRFQADPVLKNILASGDQEHNGVIGQVFPKALQTMVGTFLGNPITNLAISMGTGNDPDTGRRTGDGFASLLGKNVDRLVETAVPPWTPFLGGYHGTITRNLDTPPYMRTGRRTTMSQRVIQRILSVKMRGSLATDDVSNAFAKSVANMMGVPDDRLVDEKAVPFNERDLLAALYHSSSVLEPGTTFGLGDLTRTETDRMRVANWLEDQGKTKQAAKMRREALSSLDNKLQVDRTIGRSRIETGPLKQAEINAFKRAANAEDFDEQFKGVSVQRQAAIITGAAAAGPKFVGRQTVRDLVTSTVASASGNVRSRTSVDGVRTALQVVEDYLKAPMDRDEENLKQIEMLRVILRYQLAKAEATFQLRETQDAKLQEAVRQYEEAGLVPE